MKIKVAVLITGQNLKFLDNPASEWLSDAF